MNIVSEAVDLNKTLWNYLGEPYHIIFYVLSDINNKYLPRIEQLLQETNKTFYLHQRFFTFIAATFNGTPPYDHPRPPLYNNHFLWPKQKPRRFFISNLVSPTTRLLRPKATFRGPQSLFSRIKLPC